MCVLEDVVWCDVVLFVGVDCVDVVIVGGGDYCGEVLVV